MAQDRRTSEVVFLRMSGYSSSGTPTVKEASMKTAHDPHFPTEDNKLQPCVLAEGLHTARLSNGLRVIIREDQRSGVAICNVWVKVGSNREPEPMRGWSHGIEHMLFKGTSERGEGDFAREVAEAGGATNAGTGYETTNYHITVPAENLPQAIDILGDSLFHSSFEQESLDAERQVLVHENHMYDDIPFGFGVTWRWGCELAFDTSPYHHPIGGRDENLLERDREDIMAFWRSAYRADNMTLVVVGAVDPATTFAQVQKRFGSAELNDASAADTPCAIVAAPPVETEHQAPRLLVKYGDIKKAYLKLIFPAPGEHEGLDPVLSVVHRILSDGRSCRLYRQIQEEHQLVDDYAFMTETGPREGIVMLDFETTPERLVKTLRETARLLEDLKQSGCTEKELERAITRVSRGFLFGAETVQGQASNLGANDVSGELEAAFIFPEQVAAVTSADVQNFCRGVFRLSNLNVVVYLPEGTEAAAHDIPTDAAELQKLLASTLADDSAAPFAKPAAAVTKKKQSSTRQTNGSLPKFESTTLSNGVKVTFRVDRSLPIMTMSLANRGGATAETADNAGLSALTQAVLIKGAGELDAVAFHELLEGEGASIAPESDRDYSGLFVTAMAGRLDRTFGLLADTIASPRFDEAEITQEKTLALAQLAAVEDNPVQAAVLRMRRMMFGDHPYGRPLPGIATSIPTHTQEGLRNRHRECWVANNVQVVVSGDIDPDELLPRLESILKPLPEGAPCVLPNLGAAITPSGIESEYMERQQNQSVVLVAWPGPKDTETDRVPLMLLKEVLNGQSGRLFENLRNRQSLCYNTGLMSTAGFGQGMILGYVLTAPDTAEQARLAMVEQIIGLQNEKVTEAEFEMARAELLGHMLISSQSNASRVSRASRDRMYGRQPDDLDQVIQQVRACTTSEIRDVAQRMFTADSRFEVLLGPKS